MCRFVFLKPRIYRRLAEHSRNINGRQTSNDLAVRRSLAGLFRSPGSALQMLENNVGLLKFLSEVEARVSSGKPSAPVAVMLTMLRNTKSYKHIARVREIQKMHNERHPPQQSKGKR